MAKRYDTAKQKKVKMLAALEKTLGVVTSAMNLAGYDRGIYYKYMKEDEDFREKVLAIKDVAIDFVESKLFSQIKNDNTASTIFYLKCQGKNRGYVERSQVEQTLTVNEPVKITIIKPEKNKT